MIIANGRIIVMGLRPMIAKNLNSWDVLDLGSSVKLRDTHEDGVGNPVNYHESAGKGIIQLNLQGLSWQTDNVTRAMLKAESEPSIIRSTSQLQRTWSARLAVAHASRSVERANHSRF